MIHVFLFISLNTQGVVAPRPSNNVSHIRESMRIICSLFVIVLSCSAHSEDLYIFNGLSSYEPMKYSWDTVIEIEHKNEIKIEQSSVCVNPDELINDFPKESTPGSYWGWLKEYYRISNKQLTNLGKIKTTEIYEITYNFSKPSDYLKILAFKPNGSTKICPFLIISECCNQLDYAKSTIDGDFIITKMQDHIIGKQSQPVLRDFSFKLINGIPKSVIK